MQGLSNLLVRVGVAFAFLYPPADALANPDSWIGYFPQFVRHFSESHGVSDAALLHGFGVIEVIIALWILSGKHIIWPAVAATLMLVAIVFFNTDQFEIVFRDLAIAAAAASLAAGAYTTKRT